MEDQKIIALYHGRDETAIAETDRKYGSFCRAIALNILSIREDAEECVNDTWHAAWTKMPPERPRSLKAFLGCITRNLSISRFRANRAQKRYNGLELMLSELEECVPSSTSVEKAVEQRELGEHISDWLETLEETDRALFIRRYWYGEAAKTLAAERNCTENQLAQRMRWMRGRLKTYLEWKGVPL
ncbi:MAG: sigma-70 family RNA polymerase sigma factor [Ruminococcaceae bacterium]|nr:sigma-70 family RNA polymerase sigma factor [Oscillospiraceae bacterium]